MLSTRLGGPSKWVAAFIVVAGCGGGDGFDGRPGFGPGGDVTLSEAVQFNRGTDTQEQETLLGDEAEVDFVSSTFDIRVRANSGSNQTFEDNDFVTDDLPTGIEAYEADNGTDFLFISSVGSGNDPLDYAAYGFWGYTDTRGVLSFGTPIDVDDAGSFYLGRRSSGGDVPRSGFATYLGSAIAGAFEGDSMEAVLTGTFRAEADFADDTIAAEMNLRDVAADRTWGTIQTDEMRISGSRFNGDAFAIERDLDGDLEGAFYGPDADEVAGSFRLEDRRDGTVLGAFGGDR